MSVDTTPQTRYAMSGDVHVAYQVLGDGPIDLVCVPGWISNIELTWSHPWVASYYRSLASFSRVILFDKRGTGASDRVPDDEVPTLETRMDDVRAVMDDVGSERAVIFGVSEGGPMSILFAATYPERTLGLVAYGTSPRDAWAPDFPWGYTEQDLNEEIEDIGKRWGTIEYTLDALSGWGGPSAVDDTGFTTWLSSYMRLAASPGAASALSRMNFEIDVRSVLPSIRVPTLVLVRDGDTPVEATRYIAEHIPGARYAQLPGDDHIPWIGDQRPIIEEIQRFVRDVRDEEAELDRVLATVLFTDIVGSTEKAADLGDRRWSELLQDHHTRVRGLLARYRGTRSTPPATGSWPPSTVRLGRSVARPPRRPPCATSASRSAPGLHTGECEMVDDKVRGIAVHTGARVASLAGPGEVLVSQTVKDLVAGSGLTFEDAGEHELKGIPDRWRLYRVVGA